MGSNIDWKQQYSIIVEFLGKALGPDYEILLHDLSEAEPYIIAIANSHVSGRSSSFSLSNLALNFITKKDYESKDYKLNYDGISATGKKLRCSTMFIKDSDENLLGMLCINFDQSKYSNFASNIIKFVQDNYGISSTETKLELVENFSESPTQIYNNVIFRMFGKDGELPERLTSNQKIDLLKKLDDLGVFLIKGSVNEIAPLINLSAASIYRLLAKIRKCTT